jgi:hypothetical protein
MASGKQRLQTGKHDDMTLGIAVSPDGRLVATASRDASVGVWNALTGKQVRRFYGHAGMATRVAFSPDGKLLASGGQDSTIVLWEITPEMSRGEAPAAKEFAGLWKELASDDAAAWRAVGRLASAPGAEKWLGEQLRREVAPDPDAERLVKALDSKQFGERDRAGRELEAMADRAEVALHRGLAARPSLEAQRRIERLLEKLNAPLLPGARLRALRALEALELLGTAEARCVLQEIAAGPPSRAAREAQSALARLRAAP